jgi:Tfp pilus assembly protein PilO
MSGARLGRWRSRLRLPLMALLALNAAVFVAYTAPRALQERSLTEQAEAQRRRLETERASLQAQRQRAETTQRNSSDVEAFYRQVLPDPSQKVEALVDLDRDAPSVANHSYHAGPVKGIPVTQLGVTMPLSGSYERLVAFLRKLETGPRFVTIDRVSLHEREQGAELDLEVSLYFHSPKDVKG